MFNSFLQNFHFASDKFSDRWCREVANFVVFQGGCVPLTSGKRLDEIEQYSTGKIDMTPFIKQFKTASKQLLKRNEINSVGVSNDVLLDMSFQPIPAIPVKLNSAISLVTKREMDIDAKAIDSLAYEKIEKDIEFLLHRKEIQAVMQDISDQLGQGKIEVGGTKNSSLSFERVPLDLDLNDAAERQIFIDVVYKLMPEAAFEAILNIIRELKRIEEVERMETENQFKYGVSANRVYESAVTGICEVQSIHPSMVNTPRFKRADGGDIPYLHIPHFMTVNEFFNEFGGEIKTIDNLKQLINGDKTGYCACNKLQYPINSGDWDSTKIQVNEIQIKIVDGLAYVQNKNENKRFIGDFDEFKDVPNVKGAFAQNTYSFFWLFKTNAFFGKSKLGYAHRQQGQEAATTLGVNIYRSNEKSPVEQCIGENKKMIIAGIKMNHEIIKALPNGKFIDMKFINNTVKELATDGKTVAEAGQEILDLGLEQNVWLGSSEGFDGQNEGQFAPIREVRGGIGDNINGYLLVMQQGALNISRWTGITDELTGSNSNPDLLNGARRSIIEQSLNSLDWAFQARQSQYSQVFNTIAWYVKQAIDKGGKAKKGIEDLIGKDRTKSIEDIASIGEHTFHLQITLGRTPEQIASFQQSLILMEQKGQLTRAERLIIDSKKNIKEAYLLLAIIENKANRKLQEQQQAQMQNMQAIQQQKNDGILAAEQASTEGKIQEIAITAKYNADLMQLSQQLGMNTAQAEAFLKSRLQRERLDSNASKTERQIQAKQEQIQQQQLAPLV